jgi:WD40 repeat protein
VTPDGRYAISGSYDHTLKVWDLDTGREARTLAGHERPVHAVAVTPDGRYAISSSEHSPLKVWDLQTGREAGTLAGHERLVNAVAVTPDGRTAISASHDRTLKVWELKTGRELATAALECGLQCIVVAPDGVTILAGDRAGNIYCLKYVGGEQGNVEPREG